MTTLEFLRQFRISNYAIFDFVVSFIGIYLLSPLLSKLFRKIKLDIPKINWLYLTLPVAVLSHVLIGSITPMTADFLNLNDHYILKAIIIGLLILGLRGIKRIK